MKTRQKSLLSLLFGMGSYLPIRRQQRLHKKQKQSQEEKTFNLAMAQTKRDKRKARNKVNWKAQQDNYYFVNSPMQ